MNILGYLKQYVERVHRKLCIFFVLLALFTLLLEQSYYREQRDLIYWIDQLKMVCRHPYMILLVLLVILLGQLLLVKLQRRIEWFTCGIFAEIMRKYRSRKYADFIMRRMLWHLELAMLRMPLIEDQNMLYNAKVQERIQLAKNEAYLAVDIFRRDAAALLMSRLPLNSEDSPFFILDEEEQALLRGGYSRIGLRVSSDVLRHLLYPQSKSLD